MGSLEAIKPEVFFGVGKVTLKSEQRWAISKVIPYIYIYLCVYIYIWYGCVDKRISDTEMSFTGDNRMSSDGGPNQPGILWHLPYDSWGRRPFQQTLQNWDVQLMSWIFTFWHKRGTLIKLSCYRSVSCNVNCNEPIIDWSMSSHF